jgi:hypothetical protein
MAFFMFVATVIGPSQDAKSVAIDATHVKIHKEPTKGLQRVREVINRRALKEIAEKRHAIQQRRAKAKARAEARAAQIQAARTKAATPAPAQYSSGSVSTILACIREHESGGNYQAVNAYGYAGAYQLSPTYKDAWAARYGFSQYVGVPVVQWPPAVQDAVAADLGRDSNWHMWSDFAPYTCPW